IAHHADAVADDDGSAPHLPGEHAGDLHAGLVEDHAPAAAVAGDHHAPLGVLVLGALLGAGAGAAAVGAHANVGLIPLVARHCLSFPGSPSIWAHMCSKPGMVLAVVATSSTSTPGTSRPMMAPAVAIRWSA